MLCGAVTETETLSVHRVATWPRSDGGGLFLRIAVVRPLLYNVSRRSPNHPQTPQERYGPGLISVHSSGAFLCRRVPPLCKSPALVCHVILQSIRVAPLRNEFAMPLRS